MDRCGTGERPFPRWKTFRAGVLQCRLLLRERTGFGGAKDDRVGSSPLKFMQVADLQRVDEMLPSEFGVNESCEGRRTMLAVSWQESEIIVD